MESSQAVVLDSMKPTGVLSSSEIKNFIETKGIIFGTDRLDGGVAGYQNYGPLGVKIKNHIIELWRTLFVVGNVYEIETPLVTDSKILERSGHIKKFNDPVLILDESEQSSTRIHRADHYIEKKASEKNITVPPSVYTDLETLRGFIIDNNLVDTPFFLAHRNLMFQIQNDAVSGYLRPEIAQSMFVEFNTFHKALNKSLPFGLAQVGKSYRNEISTEPFTRLCEFTQAEVEYFFDPLDDVDFDSVQFPRNIPILSAKAQQEGKQQEPKYYTDIITDLKMNKHVAQFIIKLYHLVDKLGIADPSIMRFRQHMKDELAHYSSDCWDLEILCDGKWLECAGLAYRGDYDLTVHNLRGSSFVKRIDKSEFIPHVVEPSIGIDRLMYAVLLHKIKHRHGFNTRYVLTTPADYSIYDVLITPLSKNKTLVPLAHRIYDMLMSFDIKCHIDTSGTSIGKRYTRADEIGIPKVVTVDFQSLDDSTVTVRDRDSGKQERYTITSLPAVFDKTCFYSVENIEKNNVVSDDKDFKPVNKFEWLYSMRKEMIFAGIVSIIGLYIARRR